MKKEDFFEVLGELDGDLVAEAKLTPKKKANWKILGAMAACLTILLSAGVVMLNLQQDNSSDMAADSAAISQKGSGSDLMDDSAAASQQDSDNELITESAAADAAPMVYVNDTLYIQSSDQQSYPEWNDDFVYLGEIESDITDSAAPTDGIPKENFQANHPIVGCKVYQYGEHIVVKINDAYWLYFKYGETEVNWNDLN